MKGQLADAQKRRDDTLGALNAESAAREAENKNSGMEIACLKDKVEKMTLQMQALEAKLKRKKEKLAKVRKSFDSNIASVCESKEAECNFYKERYNKIETELQNALAAGQNEKTQNDNLQKQVQELQDKITLLDKIKNELEQ